MEAKADSLQSPCLALTKKLRAFGRGKHRDTAVYNPLCCELGWNDSPLNTLV